MSRFFGSAVLVCGLGFVSWIVTLVDVVGASSSWTLLGANCVFGSLALIDGSLSAMSSSLEDSQSSPYKCWFFVSFLCLT